MPSLREITQAALAGAWHMTTAKTFLPGTASSFLGSDPIVPVVQAFLGKLNDCAADYLAELDRPKAGRLPHYEDLFSLAKQAAQPSVDHVPNLAAMEFVRRLRSETASLHCGFCGGSSGHEGFAGLAETACDFLHWVIAHQLSSEGKTRAGLGELSKIARQVGLMDVFTLNHDLLIEEQFAVDGLAYERGFNERYNDFSIYSPGWWRKREGRKTIRLFKPHGSLNWWTYHFYDRQMTQVCIPDSNVDPYHAKAGGALCQHTDPKPMFLSGTIVKEQAYNAGFWREQIDAFVDHLSSHNLLVCCGYGFGDAGINQCIIQWVNNHRAHGLAVMSPVVDAKYFADKPLWLSQLHQAGRLVFIPKFLEHCTADEVLSAGLPIWGFTGPSSIGDAPRGP